MCKVFIIEDDRIMAECIALSVQQIAGVEVEIFGDVIAAVQALDTQLPQLIFLDILLDGPDGFTLLNELSSYSDTAKIPVIVTSSLQLRADDLGHYGVVKVLDKETMRPEQITTAAQEVLTNAE